MPIRVSCPYCRRKSKYPDQFAGHMAACRKCQTMFIVPGKTTGTPPAPDRDPEPAAPPETDTSRPPSHVGSARWNKWSLAGAREYWVGRRLQREAERARERELERRRDRHRKTVPRRTHRRRQVAGSRCRVCEDGKMRSHTEFRMGRYLGIAGYALLVIAVLGLAINFAVLATTAFGLADAVSGVTSLPVPAIEGVMRVEELTDEQLERMSPEQLRAVHTARLATAGATLGGAGRSRGGAGYAVVAWLAVGLVGRLLSLKRRLLRCTTCETVLPAEREE